MCKGLNVATCDGKHGTQMIICKSIFFIQAHLGLVSRGIYLSMWLGAGGFSRGGKEQIEMFGLDRGFTMAQRGFRVLCLQN